MTAKGAAMTSQKAEILVVEGRPYRKAEDGSLQPLVSQSDWSVTEKAELLGLAEDAPLTDDEWSQTTLVDPFKAPITIRLDADIVAWFKSQGPRYQTRINSALRRYVDAQTRAKKHG
jgi:uncharacterized protein (DUF4415 family)